MCGFYLLRVNMYYIVVLHRENVWYDGQNQARSSSKAFAKIILVPVPPLL